MELRHLRYFVNVAQELHFGRAARELGISQPPLSQQIRALEDEIGVALFDRTSRRVELTEAGRLFLAEARATLRQAGHAIDVARRAQHGELGELGIGFASSVPLIPGIARTFAAYRQAYPAVHLSLAELNRDAQLAGLADRGIDLAFIRGFEPPPLPPGHVARCIVEEPLVVAIRADHPLACEKRPLGIADIAELPIVLYHPALGAGFNEYLSALFARRGVMFRVGQEVGGIASLLGLIAAGIGVGVLARSLSALRTDNLAYRPFDDPEAITRLWLAHREALSPSAARFVELLESEAEPSSGR